MVEPNSLGNQFTLPSWSTDLVVTPSFAKNLSQIVTRLADLSIGLEKVVDVDNFCIDLLVMNTLCNKYSI